jgi:hypothetical protein
LDPRSLVVDLSSKKSDAFDEENQLQTYLSERKRLLFYGICAPFGHLDSHLFLQKSSFKFFKLILNKIKNLIIKKLYKENLYIF